MIVLYPNQGVDMNAHRCWSWFNGDDQTRESHDTDRISSLTRRVASEHSVDRSRIYVAGMSAGGAMAALLGQLFPELYAAVGVHSGLAAHTSEDLSSAMSAMRSGAIGRPMGREIPTIVFHGDRDSTVHPINGLRVIEGAVGAEGAAMKQHERASRTPVRFLGTTS
ncbi:MAG: PHB depolymerase family esterase [Gammaproteobacteria bacterium]|nr:PHB depolymerase family esterase [Gammaproteobacteria bacterium]MBU1441908.1 PHB depolymerase family esterase [Gammaproteobacteria bacterium]MBU2410238.1 PHB depolymerase family esterase [Gammaproteobacteria bacterium]